MKPESRQELTRILRECRKDGTLAERAWQLLFSEVELLARSQRRRWEGDWTLETRALANEAYLKVFADGAPEFQDRKHFYSLLATAMRQILINYSRNRRAKKRGGGAPHVALDLAEPFGIDQQAADQAEDLHEALEKLEKFDPRGARVVEMKFFVGLGNAEIADILGVSRPTVIRDWAAARAWLWNEMREPDVLDAAAPDAPS